LRGASLSNLKGTETEKKEGTREPKIHVPVFISEGNIKEYGKGTESD
jgi:hypothetical protein